jgi:hypothetical protein
MFCSLFLCYVDARTWITKMPINAESLKNLRPGNKRGPAKVSQTLKDAILAAADAAGGPGGTVAYLTAQAIDHPAAFLSLLGKVLPMQIANAEKETFQVSWIERRIIYPEDVIKPPLSISAL